MRNSTPFHYNRSEWKVKFIVGDYINDSVYKELLTVFENPDSLEIINEIKY